MWESNAFWLHPLQGIVMGLWVVAARRALIDPESRQDRVWRMCLPWIIVLTLASQVLFIFRGLEINDTTGFGPTYFGILACVTALILCVAWMLRWGQGSNSPIDARASRHMR